MLAVPSRRILGKIAGKVSDALASRARAGSQARTDGVVLASGHGWRAIDVVCTAGPHDRVFEEQHTKVAVAVVVAGTFQYRTPRGLHLMTPGSFFLGNPGECYECGHEHASGDRCLSFQFTSDFMDRLAGELNVRRATFGASRLPPMRASASVVATIATALAGGSNICWEDAALDAAATALHASHDDRRASDAHVRTAPTRDVLGRVTDVIRAMEHDPSADRPLQTLAATAGLSAFQFLRAFRRATGTTPHQYLLRVRLRESAAALRTTDRNVATIALDCGFNDLSTFTHAFRAEFGVSPRQYRVRSVSVDRQL